MGKKDARGPLSGKKTDGTTGGRVLGGRQTLVDSPFTYYPQPQYPFAPEAIPGLLRNKFIVRSELDDVNSVILPPRGRIASELAKAPYVRHMVRYDRAAQDYDQGPGSGRLVHYAAAGGQRSVVAAYIAEGGDVQARTNPAIAGESLPRGVSGLHDASLTLAAVAIWCRQHDILDDLFKAGAEVLVGGIVMLDGGDRVRPLVREYCDVDRLDIEPSRLLVTRSLIWYAVRVGAPRALELIAAYAKARKTPLTVTPGDVAAAAARKANHPRLSEVLDEHIKAGTFTLVQAGDDAMAATLGSGGDFTKTMGGIYRIVGAMTVGMTLFLALFILISYRANLAAGHYEGRNFTWPL